MTMQNANKGERGKIIEGLLIGESWEMRELRERISRVAPLDVSVLVRGPTGAGKELVSQALHTLSGRVGRFVSFNVCAIPDTMLEDALFGHVQGAFTGASHAVDGYLSEADRGTVLFDEIGSLSLPMQAKLLRVIETKEFRPVGASKNRRSDFRLVAASNEDIDALVIERRFRSDLAFRLTGVTIDVPSLASRQEDIGILTRHFLSTLSPGRFSITAGAVRILERHSWRGNVRELQNVVARMIVSSQRPVLTEVDALASIRDGSIKRVAQDPPLGLQPAGSFAQRFVAVLGDCGGDTGEAARRLRVNRATVYRWLRKLGLEPPRRRRAQLVSLSRPEMDIGGPLADLRNGNEI